MFSKSERRLGQHLHETALHKAARAGHLRVVRFLIQETGVEIDARYDACLHEVLDKTTIFITGAGLEAANGKYVRSTKHGMRDRPEYRHVQNNTFLIQFIPASFSEYAFWYLDKPGSAPYRITGGGERDLEFPFDGEWSSFQTSDVSLSERKPPRTDKSASIHSPTYQKYATALHLACELGHTDIARFLVLQGKADVEAGDSWRGQTPLSKACESGHLEVVRLLVLECSANVEGVDNDSLRPLHVACAGGHREVVRCLILDGRVNVESTDGFKRTALHMASALGFVEIVRFLCLDGGADVEAADCDGATALIRASETGQVGVARFLIQELRANVNKADRWGHTPALKASINGHAEMIQLLIEANADLMIEDSTNNSAVKLSACNGHLECTFRLWSAGMPVRDQDQARLTGTLQARGKFGRTQGFRWTVLKGNAIDVWGKLGLEQGRPEGLLLSLSIFSAYRYALMESLLRLIDEIRSPENSDTAIRRLQQITHAKSNGEETVFVEEFHTSLENYFEQQSDGVIVMIPPKSDSATFMLFSRQAREDEAATGETHLFLKDSPHSLSVSLVDDEVNTLLTNSVLAVRGFNLSMLDLSYNSSLIELEFDPFLALECLEELECTNCPRLRKVYCARTVSGRVLDRCRLTTVDLSTNVLLEALPLQLFGSLKSLCQVTLRGCPILFSPPPEICARGGRITLRFLRELQDSGHESRHMTLFLMGNGESGKTSTLKALQAEDGRSERIHEDRRTVGIDITEWAPQGANVVFKTFDLAGQAVYGKTHQLFLQRRAVYMLMWRAHRLLLADDGGLREQIEHWMDSLQNRMPGSYLVLVVTHIDMVTEAELNELCARVKLYVSQRLQAMAKHCQSGMPLLHVLDEGESQRVDCLKGVGVNELRKKLIEFTRTMPWYGERLPRSWIDTQDAILKCQHGKTSLPWGEYEELARTSGLEGDMLKVATRFLHETGTIRYFGQLGEVDPEVSETLDAELDFFRSELEENEAEEEISYDDISPGKLREILVNFDSDFDYSEEEIMKFLDGANLKDCKCFEDVVIRLLSTLILLNKGRKATLDDPQKSSPNGASKRLLQDTVFMSPYFMIDIMKGLIRHDRDALLNFFMQEQNRVMMRRVHRLSVCGRLHWDLVPFLWPSGKDAESRRFWAQMKSTDEDKLWVKDIVTDPSDVEIAVALLEGFDLLARNSQDMEFIVPGVLACTRTQITADAFNREECPIHLTFKYMALPDGAFESIVVRIAKAATHTEYSASAAVFYRLGHIGQIFYFKDDQKYVNLSLRSSSAKMLEQMRSEILRMEEFFPGLVRVLLDISPSNNKVIEPAQVVILADDVAIAKRIDCAVKKETLNKWNQTLSTALQLPRPSDYRSVLGLTKSERKDFDYHCTRISERVVNDSGWNELTVKEALKELKFDADEGTISSLLREDEVKRGAKAEQDSSGLQSAMLLVIEEMSFQHKYSDLQQKIENARVVLVCITPSVGSCASTCEQLQVHLKANRAIIPVLMGDFEIANFDRWWPDNMGGLEAHKLFVDMRNLDHIKFKASKELVPQLAKFLEEWRALPLSVKNAFSNGETELQSALIRCKNCPNSESGIENPEIFDRAEVLVKWNEYLMKRELLDSDTFKYFICRKCQFRHELHDLLSIPNIPEAMPCPLCIKAGKVPPGSFVVDACRLNFSEMDTQRAGTVLCEVCCRRIKILDLAPREVFGSYSWGYKLAESPPRFSTQEVVLPLLKQIEIEADVMCWVDVNGGMGAGEDHLVEMRRGVEAARVFLVFLSDCYVLSTNCIREFAHASEKCKFMIPVLLPETNQRVNNLSVGWTGPGPGTSNWWQHAISLTEAMSSCRPKDAPEVDWSILGSYPPIVLTAENNHAVKDQIIRRVMSRLHRSGRLDLNTQISQRKARGVLSWILLADAVEKRLRREEDPTVLASNAVQCREDPGADKLEKEDIAPSDGNVGALPERAVRTLFDLLDTDGSELIDRGEVVAALEALGLDTSEEAVGLLMQRADTDGSGKLDLAEFSDFLSARVPARHKLFERVFERFVDRDIPGSPVISYRSLKRLAEELTTEVDRCFTRDDLCWMISSEGGSVDGVVTKEQFLGKVTRTSVLLDTFKME
jgi:ankyrin repeat protein/Ca2+-binding EF-hand superfamily protein/GTPase SAR1 family protein